MEGNEGSEVSVMSEVDVSVNSEDLPNGDDSAFSEDHEHQQEVEHDEIVENEHEQETVAIAGQNAISADHVFVATSQGLLTADQLAHETGIKTTHIVIHDQTLSVTDSGLKTPTTPLPPPTPATPLSKERGIRYQWDDSVHASILPIRCKNSNGELHKAKFGSGGRGRCIKGSDGNWYTPSEYEAVCGRASSKDWKRSIRYGGRTLQCLIEDGILQVHATSCTCAACCDDESVTGPVRLFQPYKRRKRESVSSPTSIGAPAARKQRTNSTKTTLGTSPLSKDSNAVVTLAPAPASLQRVNASTAEAGETVQIITTDASGNIVGQDAVVMTTLPQTPKGAGQNMIALNVNEQKHWWQLEEMANNLIQQAQQLKAMIEQAKQQCVASRDANLQQLKAQMEKEKQDAVNAVRIEAQMSISRAVIEERNQKDIAVQHALAQARAEMQETVTVVSDDKVTYNVTWAHQPGQNNIGTIMDGEVDDSDKEKE